MHKILIALVVLVSGCLTVITGSAIELPVKEVAMSHANALLAHVR